MGLELDAEMTVHYDCDDTLIMHTNPHENGSFKWMKWNNDSIIINDPYDGSPIRVKPHFKHIAILKRHKAQGNAIVVWSAGGAKWAKAVRDALGLTDIVDLTMAKPGKICDDLPVQEAMGTRFYVKDEE